MVRLIETTDKCKSVAVIGGGFLGSELAVGLATRGEDNYSPISLSPLL